MDKLAWHFDFHSHKNIRINHGGNAKEMARTLRECGVEEIITFAKCHNGYAYYPTKVGFPHPRMKGDPFGDVVKACNAEGVKVLAYVSFGNDGEAGRVHRDWLQAPLEGVTVSADHFNCVCPFTPYLDQSVLPMIDEITRKYSIAGFFFDTMSAFTACYCEYCRKAFLREYHAAIPTAKDDPHWSAYGRFRHDRAFALLETVGAFIKARLPEAKIGFNHVGTVNLPERLPKSITCLTLDFSTFFGQSLQSSYNAAYGSNAGRPSDVMCTIFNQGWGDWTPRPPAMLEQVAASIWARKCRPYMGDRLHPENRLDPISIRAMRQLAQMAKKMKAAYPAEDAQLTPDMLILHGPATLFGQDMKDFSLDTDNTQMTRSTLEGAHRLLLDSGANFTVAPEHNLSSLSNCPLLILPEMRAIDAATELALQNHVNNGGKLLFVGKIPCVNSKCLDWVGVRRDKLPWQDHIYLPLWKNEDDKSPVLVRGDFYKLKLQGAQTVLEAIQPYDCAHGVQFGWGIGPAANERSGYPILTRLRRGKGEIWYLACPIFSDYSARGNWTQIEWFRNLLNTLVERPVAQVVSGAGSVEVVAHANTHKTWLFLINHGGEQALYGGNQYMGRKWTRTLAPLPAYPVTLKVSDSQGRKPVKVTEQGKLLKWSKKAETYELALTMDSIWRVVQIEWSKK